MTLKFARTLEEMRTVLKDPNASGPDPVYQVFTDLDKAPWVNQTEIAAGKYGDEFAKTFGHYHNNSNQETYSVMAGEGILILQKGLEVGEVFLISAKAGEQIVIPVGYGHAWINPGKEKLILFDDWATPHSPSDYEAIEKKRGMAYYIIDDNGQPKAVPNPNYPHLPAPKWLTAREFNQNAPGI